MTVGRIGFNANFSKNEVPKFKAAEGLKNNSIFNSTNSFMVADSEQELLEQQERRNKAAETWNNSEGRQQLENGVRQWNDRNPMRRLGNEINERILRPTAETLQDVNNDNAIRNGKEPTCRTQSRTCPDYPSKKPATQNPPASETYNDRCDSGSYGRCN